MPNITNTAKGARILPLVHGGCLSIAPGATETIDAASWKALHGHPAVAGDIATGVLVEAKDPALSPVKKDKAPSA